MIMGPLMLIVSIGSLFYCETTLEYGLAISCCFSWFLVIGAREILVRAKRECEEIERQVKRHTKK